MPRSGRQLFIIYGVSMNDSHVKRLSMAGPSVMEAICPRNWKTLGGDKFNHVAKLPAGRQGKGEIYMAEITLRNLFSPYFFFFLSLALVANRHFFPPLR